jgi:peroxiredoxin
MTTHLQDLHEYEQCTFREQFERDAIWSRMVAAGDRIPMLPLVEVDLGPIDPGRMLQTGPIVLVFFRYARSPECNIALRRYQRDLAPVLSDLGVHLVAVSPQVPDRLRAIKRRHDLDFFVAADPRHRLIDALNIGLETPGADVVLGAKHSVLPLPAAVVVDRTGLATFVDVPADPAQRTPAAVLADVARLTANRPSAGSAR